MGRVTVYSDHATEMMDVRGIAEWEIKLTMNQPNSTGPARDGATNYWKEIGDRTLRVTAITTSTGTRKQKKTTVFIVTVAVKGDEQE